MTDLVDIFISPLNRLNIRYIVTGSVASMVFGEPRLTNDIDVVIDLHSPDIPRLLEAFPEQDYYLPPIEIIESELSRGSRGSFNIICQKTMLKADIYLTGADPLQKWGMEHARILEIDDLPVSFAPPEYTILRKLEFYREGQSQKHIRDIASMLNESSSQIDFIWLSENITRLGLTPQWQEAQNAAHK